MFQVDVRSLVTNKLYICKDWHIQPSEIDRMAFFEYEMLRDDIVKHNKEEEKRQKEQEEQNNYSKPNVNSMMRQAQQSMPKMPSMPSMPSMPKF